MKIPFASRTTASGSMVEGNEDLLNVYAEIVDREGGKSRIIRLGVPGLVEWADPALGAIRALHERDGTVYAVAGTKLVSTTGGSVTELGTVDGSDRVSIADNGAQLVIAANGTAYVYDGSVSEITDPDFPGAASVDYLDGYGVMTRPDSAEFFITALTDFTSVDALDFASAERNPDKLLGVRVDHGEIFLFGKRSIEVWFNSGNATFPFDRRPTVIEQGCAAIGTVAQMDNSLFFLGDDGFVLRMGQYTPEIVSTPAINKTIEKHGDLSNAEACVYGWRGHKFYVLTLPGTATLVYDAAVKEWHRRSTFGKTDWNIRHMVRRGNQIVAGGTDGKLYTLSDTVYTDDGLPIEREMTSPNLWAEDQFFSVFRYGLEMETGVGLVTGQGNDPQVMLSVSKDGGRSFGSYVNAGIGKIGEYKMRALWTRRGGGRDLVLRVRMTDPVQFKVSDAFGEIA